MPQMKPWTYLKNALQHLAWRRRSTHHNRRGRLHTLFGLNLSIWELLWLGSIYGAVIIAMCFLGATARPYQFESERYYGPTLIYSSDGVLLARLYDEYRVPIQVDDLSRDTVNAILAAEDIRFFDHRGLDARGIARAFWYNLRSQRLAQGGSTITQQLVRYEMLSNERTLQRKISESVLAVRIERSYSKEQILQRYVNAVYFGGGAYGIGAAAEMYFGKKVDKLTLAESALLAGLIRAPGEGNPRENIDLAKRRQRTVLSAMRGQGMITRNEEQQARNERVHVLPRKRHHWKAPYVVESVRLFLLRKFGRERVYRGGLVVYTTVDSTLQRTGERALHTAVKAGRRQRVGNGALIAIEPTTGYIKAMVGGTDFWQSEYNRATQAHRQPGSTFKVFVYQAAIDAGHSMHETSLDAPITIGNWSPDNYGGRYRGVVSLQDALALSLNSVAVRLTEQLGPQAVIQAANRAGITSELKRNLAIALGASEVTPLEMARAFATYANEGQTVEPRLIQGVYFQNALLFRPERHLQQDVDPNTAYLLTDALKNVMYYGTGKRAKIDRPAAGKTGTSNNFRDAWFVGYTPQMSTAVWLGNDDRRPMAGVTGGTLPAQAWAEFMRTAHQGLPRQEFIEPSGVMHVRVCSVSRQLALPTCPETREITVSRSYAPLRLCPVHYFVEKPVCTQTNYLPNPTCHTRRQPFPYNAVPTQVCGVNHTPIRHEPHANRPAPPPTIPPREPYPQQMPHDESPPSPQPKTPKLPAPKYTPPAPPADEHELPPLESPTAEPEKEPTLPLPDGVQEPSTQSWFISPWM